MTEEKKKRIKELRLSGYGYSSIAALIFETRDTVRNYCRKIGLDGVMGERNPHSWENVKLAHRKCIPEKETICPLGLIGAI